MLAWGWRWFSLQYSWSRTSGTASVEPKENELKTMGHLILTSMHQYSYHVCTPTLTPDTKGQIKAVCKVDNVILVK